MTKTKTTKKTMWDANDERIPTGVRDVILNDEQEIKLLPYVRAPYMRGPKVEQFKMLKDGMTVKVAREAGAGPRLKYLVKRGYIALVDPKAPNTMLHPSSERISTSVPDETLLGRGTEDVLGADDTVLDLEVEDAGIEEGKQVLREHFKRERCPKLIREFKAGLKRFDCAACGFDFEAVYGDLGAGYIEAHHTVPVGSRKNSAPTKLADLEQLCANCHRMVHRKGLITIDELKTWIAVRLKP